MVGGGLEPRSSRVHISARAGAGRRRSGALLGRGLTGTSASADAACLCRASTLASGGPKPVDAVLISDWNANQALIEYGALPSAGRLQQAGGGTLAKALSGNVQVEPLASLLR